MLTIERDQKLTIRLHQREKFWNKTLIMAFFLALIIHMLGFILFKVKPITITESMQILPPISVVMEAPGLMTHDVVASIPADPLPNYSLPKRPIKKPDLSILNYTSPVTLLNQDSHFIASKRKKPIHFPPVQKKDDDTLNFILLADLENRQFVKKINADKVTLLKAIEPKNYLLTVDDQTGNILWISPNDELGLLISEMVLDQIPGGTITKGTLEVQLQ